MNEEILHLPDAPNNPLFTALNSNKKKLKKIEKNYNIVNLKINENRIKFSCNLTVRDNVI